MILLPLSVLQFWQQLLHLGWLDMYFNDSGKLNIISEYNFSEEDYDVLGLRRQCTDIGMIFFFFFF